KQAAGGDADHGGQAIWRAGSPFRGLERFEAEHAPVFFGRHQLQRRAVELLIDAASRGCAFQLISGPSGSGKSSLARAGIVPDLTLPGVVPGIEMWRTCLFELRAV